MKIKFATFSKIENIKSAMKTRKNSHGRGSKTKLASLTKKSSADSVQGNIKRNTKDRANKPMISI